MEISVISGWLKAQLGLNKRKIGEMTLEVKFARSLLFRAATTCSRDKNGEGNIDRTRAHFTAVLPLTLCHSQHCLLDCWSIFFTRANFFNFHPICELYRQKM